MNNKEKKINKSTVTKLVDFIQKNTDNLYKNTYFSTPDNIKDLDHIKNSISGSMDKIIDNNMDNTGLSNISQLYNRILAKDNNKNQNIEDIFEDQSITDGILASFSQNKYIKDYDQEIDLLCKYMPSLADALDAKKDNVLSADNFSKDFINVINKSNLTQDTKFNSRIDYIKEKYNLIELFEDFYDNTSKYGEQFIYVVSYSKGLEQLMNSSKNLDNIVTESVNISDIIKESSNIDKSKLDIECNNINIEFNKSNIITEFVDQYKNIQTILEKKDSGKIVKNDLNLDGLDDGLIDINKEKKTKLKVPGCIIKKLKRENVIPLYIDSMCLGYYYIELENNNLFESAQYNTNDPMNTFKFNKLISSTNDLSKDNVLKILSNKISKFINVNFINSNQDLKKEIYAILKYNNLFNSKTGNIKISFIPPDDMVHMYFTKDQVVNRGVSDLDNSLIPAKLYVSLYTTNTLGILTRSHDKRVYYVKQTVDSNISKTLLNTINQIKKSNFGTRELSSIKNVLNITGRYNDYIIPVGPSGDPPINFEVMQGQQIDTNQELLDVLEQMAINSTDVPYEYIQSRKTVDYAVRLTMSSGKFLRKVFKLQSKVEVFFSRIVKKIYECEYGINDSIEVMLPPPAFLNILNTNQMLENVDRYVESILSIINTDEDEVFKKLIISKLKRHYLSSYLDMNAIDIIEKEARLELERDKNNEEIDE